MLPAQGPLLGAGVGGDVSLGRRFYERESAVLRSVAEVATYDKLQCYKPSPLCVLVVMQTLVVSSVLML